MRCTRCQTPLVMTSEDASRWAKHSAYECPLCGHTHHSFEPLWPPKPEGTARERTLSFDSRSYSFEIQF
jgi:RNase P subunit RPR2